MFTTWVICPGSSASGSRSNHPILLAIFAAVSIVLLAWVLWRMLRIISRRRLSLDDE
jgi:hypothetical protein